MEGIMLVVLGASWVVIANRCDLSINVVIVVSYVFGAVIPLIEVWKYEHKQHKEKMQNLA